MFHSSVFTCGSLLQIFEHFWVKLEEGFARILMILSSETMFWPRRQFPARLASVLLLLVVLALNLLLWQVQSIFLRRNFFENISGATRLRGNEGERGEEERHETIS